MLPACEASCSRRCKSTVDNRLAINQTFWKLTFGERRSWLQTFVEEVKVAQRKTKRNQDYCTHSIQCNLPSENHIGLNTRVCKTMFLSTLGLKTGLICCSVRGTALIKVYLQILIVVAKFCVLVIIRSTTKLYGIISTVTIRR